MAIPQDQLGYTYEKDGYAVDKNLNFGVFKDVFIACKYNHGIAISATHGNALSKLTSNDIGVNIVNAKSAAEKARSLYLNHFRTSYPVTYKAMAIELLMHAEAARWVPILKSFPSTQAFKNWLDTIYTSAKVADINLADKQRAWDSIMESAFDAVYANPVLYGY